MLNFLTQITHVVFQLHARVLAFLAMLSLCSRMLPPLKLFCAGSVQLIIVRRPLVTSVTVLQSRRPRQKECIST